MFLFTWFAKRFLPLQFWSIWFWCSDVALILPWFWLHPSISVLFCILLCSAGHLAIVAITEHRRVWSFAIFISIWMIFLYSPAKGLLDRTTIIALFMLYALSIWGTNFRVEQTEIQNQKNVTSSLNELVEFKGYSEERIRHMWSVSNRELARQWKDSGNADVNNPAQLAGWYKNVSELYLFALSAYNLEYKRIISNIYVMSLAKGRCLDYGAGNGDLILELARRGHSAVYFDVGGETMGFALHRATKFRLPLECICDRNTLAESATKNKFDTIYALDVLEHIPDLANELQFLTSLLSPEGRIVFDVPAGSTQSHPMHLDHTLDVHSYLKSQGMRDVHSWRRYLPFLKTEKFIYAMNSKVQ